MKTGNITISLVLFVVLTAGNGLFGQEKQKEANPSNSQQREKADISQLIKNLRSNSYDKREAATRSLISRGSSCIEAIQNALDMFDDPDFTWRCQFIIESIREQERIREQQVYDENDEGEAAYLGIYPKPARDMKGVLVEKIRNGTPADVYGLRRGDILTHIDNKRIRGVEEMKDVLAKKSPGDRILVKVKGQRGRHAIRLVLAAKQEQQRRSGLKKWIRKKNDEEEEQEQDSGNRGASQSETEKLAMGAVVAERDGARGLFVQNVLDESPASKAGLEKGDILIFFDGHSINRISALQTLWKKQKSGGRVRVIIKRAGDTRMLNINIPE